jgi:hypothetical protein
MQNFLGKFRVKFVGSNVEIRDTSRNHYHLFLFSVAQLPKSGLSLLAVGASILHTLKQKLGSMPVNERSARHTGYCLHNAQSITNTKTKTSV